MKVATCRHCRRPITKPRTWLHTDGLPDCLDEWRWDKTGTFAEPEPERAALPAPTFRPAANPTGKNGRTR